MITIGFSTREIDSNFLEHIKKTCGIPSCEIIPFENKGTHSLSDAYNDIIKKSTNDIIVLCHDDIIFERNNWGNKLLKHFKRNSDYGILGVAGTTKIPKSAKWWEEPKRMKGIVNHEHQGKKWESKYSTSLGNSIEPVVLVDGLFIAINKKNTKDYFNDQIEGFHFYDVDFSIRNFLKNVKIGVIYDIRITHKSIGQTNQQWEDNRIEFAETYKEFLPLKIEPQININSPLKVLVSGLFFKNHTGSEMYIYELTKELKKLNCDITVVSDIDGPISKKAQSLGIKTLPFKEFPGYKLGDGIWNVDTPQGVQQSQPNVMYKVGNVNFDIIHVQHKPITEKIIELYPDIPKISTIHSEVIDLENPVIHDSILEYIAIRPEISEKLINVDKINPDKVKIIYNPIDTNRFNRKNIKDNGYILFVGTVDYLREKSIKDIIEYSKEQNKEVWIVGNNHSNYLDDILSNPNVKYFPSTDRVEDFVKNCSETAGILLGRTTIEGWMCGKPGWIYNVNSKGDIIEKRRFEVPNDIEKFDSKIVAKKIKEIYINTIKKW